MTNMDGTRNAEIVEHHQVERRDGDVRDGDEQGLALEMLGACGGCGAGDGRRAEEARQPRKVETNRDALLHTQKKQRHGRTCEDALRMRGSTRLKGVTHIEERPEHGADAAGGWQG